jgi:hypothetical protein
MIGHRPRIAVAVTAIFGATLLTRNAGAQTLFSFRAPHVARAPIAALDPARTREVDARASAAKITTPDDLVAFALDVTARALHFGLAHRTSLAFDGTEREGNCVEYAELFASIVNREHGVVDARAWVVRSDAKILGETLRDPAWKDHDWVLVVVRTPSGARRLFVDPTLYDMGLGWDVSRDVRGDAGLP